MTQSFASARALRAMSFLLCASLSLAGCEDTPCDGPPNGNNGGGNNGGGDNGGETGEGWDPATLTGVARDPEWRTCNAYPLLTNDALEATVDGVFDPISDAELELWERLMDHRADAGLPPIPLSPALTAVARAHVWDSATTPSQGECNMHSWSTPDAPWEPFCYTSDHAQMRKMHQMPNQLLGFSADSFENSAWGSPNTSPQRAADGWMSSAGHRSVILNTDIWAGYEWRAIGIGISGQYAHMWVSGCADASLFPVTP